jgi:hypothetical protein
VHLGDGLAHVDISEGHVPRLVPQHPFHDAAQQVAARGAPQVVEGTQGQTLHDHVHADGDLDPVIGLQGDVDELLQEGRDGVHHGELADVLLEDLDVAGLVHGLGGGVELAFVVRHCLREGRGRPHWR